ncbi:hypothetical protein V8F33_012019 [Rhypophila sp. PSN 637]
MDRHYIMSRHPRQQQNRNDEDWRSPLCDSGHGCDCPRAYFLGCVQFGRTRYRLDRLDHGEDPLDMVEYTTCNMPCWKYCLLCFGSCYIGSGVYTGRETHRIRHKYLISGDYLKDIVNGICCQPCSLIRNEAEIRHRELYPGPERQSYTEASGGPMDMEPQAFQPMYAFAVSGQNQPISPRPANEEYRPEPNMTLEDRGQARRESASREVDVQKPMQEKSGPHGAGAISPYRSDDDFEYTNRSLPRTLDAGRPLTMDALLRRNQALTPISERESEEPLRKESNPILAQIQDWIQEAGEAMAEKGSVKSGPGSSRSPREARKASPNPRESPVAGVQDITQTAIPEPAAAAELMPMVPERDVRTGRRRAVSNPSPSRGLTRDAPVPILSMVGLKSIKLNDPDRISPRSLAPQGHGLSDDKQDEDLWVTDTEDSLGKDESAEPAKFVDKQHELGRDQHTPGANTVLDGATDDATRGRQTFGGRTPSKDIEVEAPSSTTGINDLHSDVSLPTPNLVGPEEDEERMVNIVAQCPQRPEHTLSMDGRVTSTPPKPPFSHGIRFDQRIAAPELVYATLDHGILKDRRVISSIPGDEEHSLLADERVDSTATLTPNEHDIGLDKQVAASPTGSAQQRGLGEDDTVVGPSSPKSSHDTKIAQRAYQLLEGFLGNGGRNRAATNKDSRAV